MALIDTLPVNPDRRLQTLLYGLNPYDLAPAPAGITANGLPPLPAAPPEAIGSAAQPAPPMSAAGFAAGLPPSPAALSGGPGSPLPPVGPGLPPGPGGGLGGPLDMLTSPLGGPPPGGLPAGPDMAGLGGGSTAALLSGLGPGAGAGPGGPPGGAPPPGSFAAGVAAGGPPPAGSLAAGLAGGGGMPNPLMRSISAPLSAADFLAQQGHAPVPGAPVFQQPSRGEKIARALLLGVATAVNPVAGTALLAQQLARPRLQAQELANYQSELPAVQRAADVKAYEDYLNSQRTTADLVKAQTEEQRVTQQQMLVMAARKAEVLTGLINDASQGKLTPDQLKQRGQALQQANPMLQITDADIQGIVDKTPQVGAKYKVIWTGPQGTIPHVQDRAGNEYDMSSAPDPDARNMLKMAQDQIDSAVQKQLDQKREEIKLQFSPEAIAGAAAKSGAEATARTKAELSAGQQMVNTPQTQAIAKAIIDGRMKAPSSFALKTPYWQAVMGEVMNQDPTWNEQRAQLRSAYTVGGKQATEINAINTAMAHVGVLGDSIAALNNGNTPALNALANSLGVQIGKDNVTTFRTIVNRVGPELTKAYLGAGGSAGERGTTEADFDPKLGPQQLQSNVGITARLLRSKIAALENPWDQNAPPGAGQDFQSRFIMPEAKQALDKWAPAGGGGGGAGGGAGAGGGGVFDVSKLKQNNPQASPAQIQDAIARAQQRGMRIINQ